MHFPRIGALLLGFTEFALVQGQNLSVALQGYPDLSSFRQVLDQYPSLFSSIISNTTQGVTVLAPTNEALQKYVEENGQLASIPLSSLKDVMAYHVMATRLTSANFTDPHGLTVPTFLEGPQYNNRTPGSDLTRIYGPGATGQVLFVQQDPSVVTPGSNSIGVRGGLGQNVNLTAIDGQWDLGYFQIIDEWVLVLEYIWDIWLRTVYDRILTPPMPCSDTIENQPSLKAMDETLDKVPGVYDVIDYTPNVTCLAPSNDAYDAAGSAQDSLNRTALTNQLLWAHYPTNPPLAPESLLMMAMEVPHTSW